MGTLDLLVEPLQYEFMVRALATTAIAAVTPILRQIDVDVEPNAGSGPSYGTTSYAADNW